MDLEDVIIRNAKDTDYEMIKRLVKELYNTLDIKIGLNEKLTIKKYNELLEEPKTDILVADLNGIVIGYLTINYNKSLLDIDMTAIIDELVVTEDHRSKGVGTKLVTIAVKKCKYNGCSEIGVGTEFTNKKARTFYERCGFKEIGVIFEKALGQ